MKNPWIHKNGKSTIDKRSKQHKSTAKTNAAKKKKNK